MIKINYNMYSFSLLDINFTLFPTYLLPIGTEMLVLA